MSGVRYHAARYHRTALRALLRPMASWRALERPEPGYSVIIGALAEMPEVVRANLRLLRRQDRRHLREVIVVFDRPRDALPEDFERVVSADHDDLSLRCLFYSPAQARVLKAIGWAWCYSWLSWCIGIAACRTRHALLHDLDALLLRRDILEQRYDAIRRRGHEFLGRTFYKGNGIDATDGLVVTFELMLDAAWVRRTFEPIDLFNRVSWFRGRRVEFDTLLHAQARRGRASTLPIDAEDLVHPSQVFCQYTELLNRWRYVLPEQNNLPMLPYLLHLGGNDRVLPQETTALRHCAVGRAVLFGHPMDVSRLSHRHLDWLTTQVRRVERVVAGGLRPEVRDYFDALRALIPTPRPTPTPTPRPTPTPIEAGGEPAVARPAFDPVQRLVHEGGDRRAAQHAPSIEPAARIAGEAAGTTPSFAATEPTATAVATAAKRTRAAHRHGAGDEPEASYDKPEPATGGGAPQAPEPGGAPDDERDEADDAPRRVALHGVAFDAITESACVQRVVDALDAGRGGWIITPNLDHLRRAHSDAPFRAMLREADLVVADGMPLIWASRLQATPLPERVAGSSMVSTLAAAAGERGRSLFLLGGEPGTAEAAGQVLLERHPGLRLAGTFCPPMGFEADERQMQRVRDALIEAQPDIVYVALGSPKQERLIRELRAELPQAWWIGVGISLSFLCGRVRRAPPWVQRLGLEWMHRLAQEPRRLARRYLIEGLPFAVRLLTGAAAKRVRGKGRSGGRGGRACDNAGTHGQ